MQNLIWVDDANLLDFHADAKSLLMDVKQLTAYWRSRYPHYHLQLLSELWQRADLSNFSWRDLEYWVRTIAHKNADVAVGCAQTFVPKRTFEHFSFIFQNLGQQSIGEVFLYRQQNIVRSPFKYALCCERNEVYGFLQKMFSLKGVKPVPVRASVFDIKGYPLLILEYFNPSLF